MLDNFPRPLLVVIVLALGVAAFFYIQKPITACDLQVDIFKESQAGHLYPRKVKNVSRAPSYFRLNQTCKEGNSPGACYEYFALLRRAMRDLNGAPTECLPQLGELREVRSVMNEGPRLMAQMAWGDEPPARGAARFGWFEAADLALFCQVRDFYYRMYGQDTWEKMRMSTYPLLPGEKAIFENGKCLNCDYRKKASEVFTPEDLWALSVFSLRCESYR